MDVYKKGHDIRYSNEFEEEGINVNFVEQQQMIMKSSYAPMNGAWKMKPIAAVPVLPQRTGMCTQ